ncbi:MAG: (2Fe-2S) ferredoxin domain-containing protein [Deltaproteobacteria bacterium]|nr:(2Fe-2S) ferredoxin domain-containing protein [Deltaproteobacteria bacterium]
MAARVDVWICQGRMCTANGSDQLAARARDAAALSAGRCRVLRGGCYGLCELGPNVVVREHEQGELPDENADRLSLTNAPGEAVYCVVAPAQVATLVAAHLDGTGPVQGWTRAAREAALPAASPTAARVRAVRRRRQR